MSAANFAGAWYTHHYMFYVYVLENQEDHSFYIGYSADLKQRLHDHTTGKGARTTRLKKDWKLIYYEAYIDKSDALGREKFLKGGSGRTYLRKQMRNYLQHSHVPSKSAPCPAPR